MSDFTKDDIITILEKVGLLVVRIIRRTSSREEALRKITDLTQQLKAEQSERDARLADIYDEE